MMTMTIYVICTYVIFYNITCVCCWGFFHNDFLVWFNLNLWSNVNCGVFRFLCLKQINKGHKRKINNQAGNKCSDANVFSSIWPTVKQATYCSLSLICSKDVLTGKCMNSHSHGIKSSTLQSIFIRHTKAYHFHFLPKHVLVSLSQRSVKGKEKNVLLSGLCLSFSIHN